MNNYNITDPSFPNNETLRIRFALAPHIPIVVASCLHVSNPLEQIHVSLDLVSSGAADFRFCDRNGVIINPATTNIEVHVMIL